MGAQTFLVSPGASWKYLDNGSNQGTAWRATNFNDSAWASGPAELGYGDTADGRPERTVVSYGTNASAKYVTTYFRHTFVATPNSFTNLVLGVVRDDGAVVYLNGAEIWRNNMPLTAISYLTAASTNVTGADEATFFLANLNPLLLRTGTNVLAVEIHQNTTTGTDISFDLFLAGQTAGAATAALAVHVAPGGNDGGPGSAGQPLATLERARDLVRSYAQAGFLPKGGAVIEVAGGRYELARPLDLAAGDSGTATAPVIWRARAGEEVLITGGRMVNGFTPVSDAPTLARLDPAARGRVYAADLRAEGITNFTLLTAGSTWAQSDPGLEVFWAGQPMTLARWPNDGYARIVDVLGATPFNVRGTTGTVEGILLYSGDRPTRWIGEPEAMVHGYWCWDWADQRQRVQAIDPVNHILTIAAPYHTYGYRPGQWFYAFNLLPELDMPGEWYLDRTAGLLYFWPPGPLTNGAVMVSALSTLLTVSNASYVTFEGFTFEGAQRMAISISGGMTNRLQSCTIRNVGKNGISLQNSPGSGVSGGHIYFCGDSGISLGGGTRATLTPAGMYVEQSHLHHWSRWNPVYHAGIVVSGVGNRIAHNSLHDAPHEGIAFGGNDHLIEFNEFHNLVNESNDAGVIYSGRTWSTRGHVIRHNYFHHIYGFEGGGANCVYLDDQFSSALVYGNLFYQVPRGVLVGGGRNNFIGNNVFVACQTSISLDARGLGWASTALTTLSNELVSLPYQGATWSARYPELTNVFNENPMAPMGNVIGTNIAWAGGWTSIETAAQAGVLLTNNLTGIDPLFADTNRLNFALQSNSPAFALGFQPLPLAQIGPDPALPHAPWPPTLTLVSPRHLTTHGAPADLQIDAVLSDPARSAGGVDFFAGNAWLGRLTSGPPHSFTWSNTPAGRYTLAVQPAEADTVGGTLNRVVVQLEESIVAAGSTWRYLDNGSNQGTAWRGTNFNDASWKTGQAELGYGDDAEGRPERTVVSYGPNVGAKYITTYFRRAFNVPDPARYTNLVMGLLRDDGAVVYLNGTEVFRSNLPTGAVTHTTQAISSIGNEETVYTQTNWPAAWLRPGTNWLAVEIHQVNGTSSDISFDLYLMGQMDSPTPRLGIRRGQQALGLEWPAETSDFLLESTTNTQGGGWQPVRAVPALQDGRVRLNLPADADRRFYRLVQP